MQPPIGELREFLRLALDAGIDRERAGGEAVNLVAGQDAKIISAEHGKKSVEDVGLGLGRGGDGVAEIKAGVGKRGGQRRINIEVAEVEEGRGISERMRALAIDGVDARAGGEIPADVVKIRPGREGLWSARDGNRPSS